MAAWRVRGLEAYAVDEVFMRFVLKVLAAVRELAARRIREEKPRVRLEPILRVVCLQNMSVRCKTRVTRESMRCDVGSAVTAEDSQRRLPNGHDNPA